MAQVHTQIQSFNAGELSPLLGARFGVEKVASGCRRLRNFLLHVHGPAFRRPGLEYLGAAFGAGAKSRLWPFNFSTTTGALLELHPSGLRVWSNGALVPLRTPVALPYSEAECAEVQIIQVNDVCYLAHPNHSPRKLIRYADTDWRISEIAWKWPALGDEAIRSDEIAGPSTTELLNVPTYELPEFTAVANGSLTFTVTGAATGAEPKRAKLQRLISGRWRTIHTLQWTTSLPTPWVTTMSGTWILQIVYDGPVLGSGTAAGVSWFGGGSGSLPLDILQPVSARTLTIASGDWQASVTCPASIPRGASLELQGLVGTKWKLINKMKLLPGKTTVYKGAKLTAPKTLRFEWSGRAMNDGSAKIDQPVFPVSTDITLAVNETSGTARVLTASAPLFTTDHLGSYWQISHRREKPWVALVADTPTISADQTAALTVQGKWQVTTYGIWQANLFLEKLTNGAWETLRSWSSTKNRNIIADGEEDHAVELRLRISAGISEDAGTPAAQPRFVLEALDARVNGLVRVTAIGTPGASGKSTTATVDIIAPVFATTATAVWTEGSWSDQKGHPRCVALHGGRLFFGGTKTEPNRLWGSAVNDYEDFRRSSLDDAGVSFTPAAQSANAMQWMLSHERELNIGTAGDEWTLGTESGPLTPTNVLMQRRSSYGSQSTLALLVNDAVIFVQRGGRKLRQITPRGDATAWTAADMTVLAEHVTQSGLVQIAATTNPFSILWAVTGDGKLLGMTLEAEQNVFGWHVHETDGAFESVAVVRGPEVDEVWVSVNRAGVRSIERFDSLVLSRRFDRRNELIYVDAAKRVFSVVAVDTVTTGLAHLEGKEVAVLADGIELPRRRVIDGTITLETPARNIVVGLPFTSELQPMRLDIPLRDGTAQGRNFKLSRVAITLHDSLGGEVADGLDGRFEQLNYRRVSSAMDTVPALFTGDVEFPLTARTRTGLDVTVRQSAPLPLNVGAIVLKADVYGD